MFNKFITGLHEASEMRTIFHQASQIALENDDLKWENFKETFTCRYGDISNDNWIPELKTNRKDVWNERKTRDDKFLKLVANNDLERARRLIFSINTMLYLERYFANLLKLARLPDLLLLCTRNGLMSVNILGENIVNDVEALEAAAAFSVLPHSFYNFIRRGFRWYDIGWQMKCNDRQKEFAKLRFKHGWSAIKKEVSDIKALEFENIYSEIENLKMNSYKLKNKRYIVDKLRHVILLAMYIIITVFSLVGLDPIFNAVAVLFPIVAFIGLLITKYCQAGNEHNNYNKLKNKINDDEELKKILENYGIVSTALIEAQMRECEKRRANIRWKIIFSGLLFLATAPILVGELDISMPVAAIWILSAFGIAGAVFFLEYKVKKLWGLAGILKSIFLVVAGIVLIGGTILIVLANPDSWLVAALLGLGLLVFGVIPNILSCCTPENEKFFQYVNRALVTIIKVAIAILIFTGTITFTAAMPYVVIFTAVIAALVVWSKRKGISNSSGYSFAETSSAEYPEAKIGDDIATQENRALTEDGRDSEEDEEDRIAMPISCRSS